MNVPTKSNDRDSKTLHKRKLSYREEIDVLEDSVDAKQKSQAELDKERLEKCLNDLRRTQDVDANLVVSIP